MEERSTREKAAERMVELSGEIETKENLLRQQSELIESKINKEKWEIEKIKIEREAKIREYNSLLSFLNSESKQ